MESTRFKFCFYNFKKIQFFSSPVFPVSFFFYDFRFWFQYFGFFTRYLSYMSFLKFFYENFYLGLVTNNFFIIRFYLKGIGYKFLRPKKNKNFLRIELGHSVSNYILIPSFIKVTNKRDKIAIFGFNKSFVKDFSKKIYALRPADVYKGKGIRVSSIEYKNFKPGKQRLLFDMKVGGFVFISFLYTLLFRNFLN